MKKKYKKNFFNNFHESEFFGQLIMKLYCVFKERDKKRAVTKYAIHAIHT